MPKEETIEARHIRNVIGDTSDLPSLNPRASLVSRIRSVVTKFFGATNIIHLQGALGQNESLTFDVGESNTNAIFSDGTYLYAGLETIPGKIVKVDLATFTKHSTLTLDSGENNIYAFVSDGTYLYVGLTTTPGKIVKINLADFTKNSTLTLDAGENIVYDLATDGTYLYAGLATTPAKVVKIDLTTFTKDSTLSLTGNTCTSLFLNETTLYAAVSSTYSISKVSLATFTETSTLVISLPPVFGGPVVAMSLFSDGLYLYITTADDALTCNCTKIDLDTFTQIQYLDVGLISGLFSDGTNLYLGSSGVGGISKIDLNTFKTSYVIPVPEGPIRSIFSDGTYIYAGVNVDPGMVVRKYIVPFADTHQRKIDTTKECIQSTISGTTSDGLVNGTTLIDTARTEASDFWNNMTLLILGGAYKGQARKISDFDFATNTLTVAPGFGGKILSGVKYAILPYISSLSQADILSDATPFAGANIDVAISTRATQADILSDATPFAGADIATIKGDTDNLVASITDGTYTHASNTNEQNVFVITAATQEINIFLDMVAVTQLTTIREYMEVDGTNLRLITAKIFPTDFDTAAKVIVISLKQPNKDYRITLQSSVAEGASIDIPWTQMLESRS